MSEENVIFRKLGEAEMVKKNLKNCIYCSNPLPAKNKEHIFNSTWCGIHKTSRIICDRCNEEFSEIDGAFYPYTKFIMNAWSFKGQRCKNIPKIECGDNLVLVDGAKPQLKNPKRKVSMSAGDGEFSIKIEANSIAELMRELKEVEKEIGRPFSDKELRKLKNNAQRVELPPGPLKYHTVLNFQKEYRSTAHTILKCIGLFDSSGLILNEETLPIRNFARYDK